jgi:hypothetical protein
MMQGKYAVGLWVLINTARTGVAAAGGGNHHPAMTWVAPQVCAVQIEDENTQDALRSQLQRAVAKQRKTCILVMLANKLI